MDGSLSRRPAVVKSLVIENAIVIDRPELSIFAAVVPARPRCAAPRGMTVAGTPYGVPVSSAFRSEPPGAQVPRHRAGAVPYGPDQLGAQLALAAQRLHGARECAALAALTPDSAGHLGFFRDRTLSTQFARCNSSPSGLS